jgi:hypothetical protein
MEFDGAVHLGGLVPHVFLEFDGAVDSLASP